MKILVLPIKKNVLEGIRALLDTVMQALPQVGNLGLLFFLLFFIFAALGVEMFGRLGKYEIPFDNFSAISASKPGLIQSYVIIALG